MYIYISAIYSIQYRRLYWGGQGKQCLLFVIQYTGDIWRQQLVATRWEWVRDWVVEGGRGLEWVGEGWRGLE